MKPEQEIERIKKDYAAHWPRLEKLPEIQEALKSNNPVLLAEVANKYSFGDYATANATKRKQMLGVLSWTMDPKNSN
jgi:hypothetical protein